MVDGKTSLHVALSPSAQHGDVDFDIYSGEADACVHAQGTGRIVSEEAAGPLDIDAAILRMREVPASTDHAPAAWRLWRGAGELLIAVDDQHLSPSPGVMIVPTLANAVFDRLSAVLALGSPEPADIASLDALSPCGSKMWIWVRWSGGEMPTAGTSALDMDWCDGDGHPCLRWRGWVPAGTMSADAAMAASQSEIVLAAIIAAPVPGKPDAIALDEPAAVPAITAAHLPKPNAARLPMLDAAVHVSYMPISDASASKSQPVAAAPFAAAVERVDEAPKPRHDVRGFLKRSLAQALYLGMWPAFHLSSSRTSMTTARSSISAWIRSSAWNG